jgi:SAM-dependent methyltransferase
LLESQLHASDLTEDDVVREISPNDGCFTHTLAYFEEGLTAARFIRASLEAVPLTRPAREVRRVLDLPCGHGRVLRWLQVAFPGAEITACDLDRDGVDFCAETFGATPVYSEPNPQELELPGSFDLIWVGSLLTHLDASRWHGWLDLFESALAEDGLLVFTTHGRGVADRTRRGDVPWPLDAAFNQRLLAGYDEFGFGYQNYPHDPDYGLSLSSPSWVCSQIEGRPELRLLTYGELAWNGWQDIVSCVHRPTEGVQVGFGGLEEPAP